MKSKLAERDAEAAERSRNLKDTSSFLLSCMEDVKAKVVEVDVDNEQKSGDNTFKLLPGVHIPLYPTSLGYMACRPL